MTEVAELMLVVDSRPAEAGAKRTQAALENVGRSATSLSRNLVGSFGSGGSNPVQKGIDSIGASATRATPILAGLSRQILGLAGGLGAAKVFSDFVRTTGTLDQNVRKIAQIQGLDRTADNLERIGNGLRDVGSGFFSQSDTAAAVREAAAANFTLAESFEVASSSEGLARDAALDYAKATGLVASATKALGLGASESARVAAILARIGDLDPEGIANYVGVIQKIGPEARKATIGPAELGAALQVLDDEGQNATTTGRDLTGIINAMISPSKDAAAALRDIGLTTADIDPRAQTLGQIFERLAEVQLDAARAGKIFGDGNSATAIALARNAGKVSALEDELSDLLGLAADKRPRELVEAIAAIGNAYEDLLVSAARAGASDVLVKGLAVLREILDDISGKDQEISKTAKAIELTGVAIASAYLAPRIVSGIAAVARGIGAVGVAAAANPLGALATGATVAIPLIHELTGALDELTRGNGFRVVTEDEKSFHASFASVSQVGAIATSPAAGLNDASKQQLDALSQATADALKSGNIINQRVGVAAGNASKKLAEQVIATLDQLKIDGGAAAEATAQELVDRFVKPLLAGKELPDALRSSLTNAASGFGEAAAATSTNAEAAETAADAQIRMANALEAAKTAAEAETKQIEALNAAFESEAALRFEASLVGLSDETRTAFEQIEAFRQTLLEAGVSAEDVGVRTQAYANALHGVNEAARAAAGGVSELEGETEALRISQEAADAASTKARQESVAAQKSGLDSATRLRQELDLERATLGLTAEEAARFRKEIEFADAANKAFGAGSAAAETAIAEYNAELANISAEKEAIQVSRDLAEAVTGPLGSALDDTVEKLIKGEAATIDFQSALLDLAGEVGKGVFHNLVTKPLTEKATAGLAGVFGGIFGNGEPPSGAPASAPTTTQSSPADVLGQAGAGAAAAAGGAFTSAQVINIQAAVVNLAQGLVPGAPAAGGGSVAAGVQGLAGLASAFGGGNSPAGVPDSGTGGTGSSLLGLSSLAATSGTGGGTTSTAVQAQASVQPTSEPVPERAALGGAATGAAAGAQVGTAIAPGIGSAIGFIAGALLGYAASYYSTPSRRGNVVHQGRLIPHANGGVVDQFSVFPLRDGRYGSLAEDGPEAILPLRRGRGGRLGVELAGGGGRGGDVIQVSVTQNIATPDTGSFRRYGPQLAADQRKAQRRNATRRT